MPPAVPRAGGCGPVRASSPPIPFGSSGSLTPPDGHGSRGRAGKGRRNGSHRQLPLRNAAQYGATCCPVRRYLRLRCPRMRPAASIAAAAKNALLSDETDGEGHRGGEGPSTRPSMERKVPSGARRTGRSSKTTPPVGGMPP